MLICVYNAITKKCLSRGKNIMLSKIDKYMKSHNKLELSLIVFILILVIGILDYFNGFDIKLSFFYVLPVLIITWYGSLSLGMFAAAISSLLMLPAGLFGAGGSNFWAAVWNSSISFMVRMMLVFIVWKVHLGEKRNKGFVLFKKILL